jgi:hypothetical protein
MLQVKQALHRRIEERLCLCKALASNCRLSLILSQTVHVYCWCCGLHAEQIGSDSAISSSTAVKACVYFHLRHEPHSWRQKLLRNSHGLHHVHPSAKYVLSFSSPQLAHNFRCDASREINWAALWASAQAEHVNHRPGAIQRKQTSFCFTASAPNTSAG